MKLRSENPPRTILLVEDSDTVRAVIARMLSQEGFPVIEACGFEEAASILRRETVSLALLLTDIVMPKSSGIELARMAKRLRPGLPILLMTGDSKEAVEESEIGDGAMEWIEKPFTQEQIAAKIREILSR